MNKHYIKLCHNIPHQTLLNSERQTAIIYYYHYHYLEVKVGLHSITCSLPGKALRSSAFHIVNNNAIIIIKVGHLQHSV